MTKRRTKKTVKKKRTLSEKQLAAMKAGRERAKRHRERVAGLAGLEERLRKGAMDR